MFIRKTKTGSAPDGTARHTIRLVENHRVNGQVKQRTLLNLGRHFRLHPSVWKLLCQRIEELLNTQSRIDFTPPDPNLEAEARRIVSRLLERQGESMPAKPATKDFQSVDVNSAEDSNVRTAGVEPAALEALETLGMPQLLIELGFNRRQRCLALATIVARMAAPASERETHRWLRQTSALGEMLGIDFGALSEMALYRISDQLLAHQAQIEAHLFERALSWFSLQPTIAFYDLTNTYLEGQAKQMPDAKRGRSKEKRSDCPLLTLALVVDGSGFVMKSRLFAGNVSESGTLAPMIEGLGGHRDAVVVLDRGVATAANLKWLKDRDYRYVVVSRKLNREFDFTAAQTLQTASHHEVSVYKEITKHTDEDGHPYEEAYLRCYSREREAKENGLLGRFMKRFEEGLEKINASLGKPRAQNKRETVERRIGRLEKANARAARHYQVKIHADESGKRVKHLSWKFEPVDGTLATHPGVYSLRSNLLDWDAETLWRTYMTLTEVEAVFRALKSELGLRPVYHQKQRRANGHLFISVLAYQAVCVLRTRMKASGRQDSWTTIRNALGTITRTTTSFERRDGRTLHVRKTAAADADQAAMYAAMDMAAPPRNLQKTIV